MLRNGLVKYHSQSLRGVDVDQHLLYSFILREACVGSLKENRDMWDKGVLGYASGSKVASEELGWSEEKVNRVFTQLVDKKSILVRNNSFELGIIKDAETVSLYAVPGEAQEGEDEKGLDAIWGSIRRKKESKATVAKTKRKPRLTYEKKDSRPTVVLLRRFSGHYQRTYGEPPEWQTADPSKYASPVYAKAGNCLRWSGHDLNKALEMVDYLFSNLEDYKERAGLKDKRVDLWCICSKEHYSRLRDLMQFNLWRTTKSEAAPSEVKDRANLGSKKTCQKKSLRKPKGSFL